MKIKKRITAFLCAAALSVTQVIEAAALEEFTGDEEHAHSYVGAVTKEATCAEEGEMTYTCECGESFTEAIPRTTAHKYGVGVVEAEASCGVEGRTVYTCKICGSSYTQVTPALSHEFDEGEITKQATCTDKGIMTHTCKLCGSTFDSETETDPEAHEWDEGVYTKKATCNETGTIEYTCILCGETKQETVPSTGAHMWDEGKVTTEPSCGKPGVMTYTCTDCKETKTEEIPATGDHYFGKGEIIKEADCTHAGLKHFVCKGCGLEVDTIIPKSAVHRFDSGKVTKEPTLSEEGSITYTCTLCSKTLTRAVPKLIDISKLDITLSASSYTYNGSARKPAITIKNGDKTLNSSTDYNVTYSNNINAGTASVTIYGKGAYTSSVKKTFSIIAADVGSSTVSGVNKTYVYTGKSITPTVTVKLSSKTLTLGSEYTLTFASNKKIGTASVTIKGKGNYKGTKKVTFSILPKATTLSKLTTPKKQNLKIAWKKNAQATGYQIVYSTDKSFSTKNTTTVTSGTTVSKTLTWLTSGKTYYVKIRAYKTVGGTKYYGAYSAVKSLKVK